MYLRVNEQRYSAAYNTMTDEVFLSYDGTLENNSIVINQYVCLFDDSYAVVEEVFSFLENRLHVKHLAFNTVATKGSDLKLFYDFLQENRLTYKTVTKNHINDFIAWLTQPDDLHSKNKRTGKSVNRIVSSIKDFYDFHSTFGSIQNPFKHAKETITRPTYRNKGFYTHTQETSTCKSIFKIKELWYFS